MRDGPIGGKEDTGRYFSPVWHAQGNRVRQWPSLCLPGNAGHGQDIGDQLEITLCI